MSKHALFDTLMSVCLAWSKAASIDGWFGGRKNYQCYLSSESGICLQTTSLDFFILEPLQQLHSGEIQQTEAHPPSPSTFGF